MDTQINKTSSPHALIWIVGIAITLFCLAGIAAFMGWIPNSVGGTRDGLTAEKVADKKEADKIAADKLDAEKLAERNTERHNAVAAKPVVHHVTEKHEHVTHTETHTAPVYVASNAPVTRARCDDCGVVESTRVIESKGSGSGLGGVGGAVVGGLLGNQVGNGRGKDVMTVVGAVGGAVAGNEIEKRVKATKTYEVTVRLEDGSTRVINEGTNSPWHTGDRVRVVNGVIQSNS